MNVLKIGGNQLDDPAFIAGVARIIADQAKAGGELPVIVHGGGKGIKALQEKLGLQATYIGGLRVTDDATMEIVQMVLCGVANLTLVSAMIAAGVEAQGFNGADRGILRGTRASHPDGDLMRVGNVSKVRSDVILEALAQRVVPIIAPVLLAEDAEGFYNCNADRAAGAVAAAIAADRVLFLTDVPGVLNDGAPIEHITKSEVEDLIESGVIKGGMAVKLGAALDALSAGVPNAVITNLAGLAAGTGTTVSIG